MTLVLTLLASLVSSAAAVDLTSYALPDVSQTQVNHLNTATDRRDQRPDPQTEATPFQV